MSISPGQVWFPMPYPHSTYHISLYHTRCDRTSWIHRVICRCMHSVCRSSLFGILLPEGDQKTVWCKVYKYACFTLQERLLGDTSTAVGIYMYSVCNLGSHSYNFWILMQLLMDFFTVVCALCKGMYKMLHLFMVLILHKDVPCI